MPRFQLLLHFKLFGFHQIHVLHTKAIPNRIEEETVTTRWVFSNLSVSKVEYPSRFFIQLISDVVLMDLG
ncbi:hypothetical protein AAC387_Pa01g0967 [Persea americana]